MDRVDRSIFTVLDGILSRRVRSSSPFVERRKKAPFVDCSGGSWQCASHRFHLGRRWEAGGACGIQMHVGRKGRRNEADGGTLSIRYMVLRELNRGGVAVVYKGIDGETGEKVALKVLELGPVEAADMVKGRVEREIRHLAEVRHENIVSLLNVFVDGDQLVIVLELIEGYDLLEVLNRKGGVLVEDQARHYFLQLLSGVEFMHEHHKICHRDLKPENCMIELKTDKLKIIDLGLSKRLQSARTLGVGTPGYMAPELLHVGNNTVGQYDASLADVWSLGSTLYLMTTGFHAWEDPNHPKDISKTLYNCIAGRYRKLPPHLQNTALADLLKKMLVPSPYERLTLQAVWEHEWVSR